MIEWLGRSFETPEGLLRGEGVKMTVGSGLLTYLQTTLDLPNEQRAVPLFNSPKLST